MSLLAWIVLGLVAGFIATRLTPGRGGSGCLLTTVIGVIGALLGGWLSTELGYGGLAGRLDWRNLAVAVLGSLVLLLLARLVSGRRS
jgi:uncharacterized membrane protein YeaQ/YmgE (transglycosylase-associated protein family)